MTAESNHSEGETGEPGSDAVEPVREVGEVVEPVGEVVEPEETVAVEPAGEVVEPEETVQGLPVLADVRPIEPASPQALPAVQAAVAAATGFVAGAATVALVRRHTVRRLTRGQGLDLRRPGAPLPAAGAGRTFLVHVRVLGRPES